MTNLAEGSAHAGQSAAGPTYSLWQITAYALRLGTLGFGGPVALVGYMHRDLVEQRKWISEADYKEGLTLAQLMPGPLAAQLAIYLGYVHYGVLGATLVGISFVLPSFSMVVALGWAYQLYGGLAWMQAVFYGVGACVIGIILISATKLTQKTIGRDKLLWTIYLVSAAVTVITESEIIWLFLGAGVLTWLAKTPPKFGRGASSGQAPAVASMFVPPLAALAGGPVATSGTLLKIFLFFTKAGAFVFGSGLAIVPFLYSGVVKEYGWLNDQQFLDAVAVAMITPGPVVITVGFIGFLVGGFEGATIAALATFLPCYLLTIIPAPYFKKHGKRPGIVAFVDGVTAAAVGAIAGAVLVLGRRTIFEHGWSPEVPKLLLLLITLGLLLKFKKLPEPLVVLGAAIVGLVLHPFVYR
jgi:chromate transporter